MPYSEDDIRAAFRSLASQAPDARAVLTRLHEQLDPADRPGHRQPGGRPRFNWRLLIPLAAAAAVIAVIAVAIAFGVGDQPRPVAPPPSPVLGQAPPYYMYLPDPGCGAHNQTCPPAEQGAVVRSTRTGATVGKVLPPKSTYFTYLAGASDDRTFVLFVVPSRWAPPKSCATSRFSPDCFAPNKPYVAHFDPAHGAITLRALPIPVIRLVSGLPALSPNGTELAVDTGGAGRAPVTQIRVYSLTNGAVKVWHGPGSGRTMAWGPDGQLGVYGLGSGIVILNTNTPGGSVQGASRLAVTYQQPGNYHVQTSFAVSGDGQTIIAPVIPPTNTVAAGGAIRWFSTATGRQIHADTPPPAAANGEEWQVLWTNSSGSVTVLRRTASDKTDRHDYFGVLSGSKFVPIPMPSGAAQAGFFFSEPIAF